MALAVGDKLGPYEIIAPIGAGGMGEVYRAHDSRLNRDVAIKLSKDEFTERFSREARSIAALNHPNICTLYDVGPNYLVMEYVEGTPLKGPLPLDQTLKYAAQICDALDAAHKKNITHRDLKPANILVTKAGVKLLDFGLAKMGPAVKADESTMTMALTGKGEILGTLLYMSPEQLNGEEAGPRSDIFSFGLVLYGMVTGKKAFEGKSQASLIAAILEREPPPMASLQPMTPPALDRLVKKCLAKEPEKRWQAASDISDALKWIAEDNASHGGPSAGPVAAARVGSRWLLLSALACVLAAAVAALTIWLLKPAASKPVTRFVMSLPTGQRLGRPGIAISPDGTRLVYAAGQGTAVQLYLRAMDGLETRAIPGTEDAVNPFFSSDGQWIGFSAGGKLKKVSLSGGPPVSIADLGAGSSQGASWGSKGIIAFAPQPTGPIQQVSDAGGNMQPLTRLEKGEGSHRFPEFLPDGTALLFNILDVQFGIVPQGSVAVQSLKTGERRELIRAGNQPRYAPSGHIVYSQGANLIAAPFDLRRLAVTGTAVPVIEGVLPFQYSFSSTGSLVYVPGSVQAAPSRLVWVDRKGAEQPVPAPLHSYVMPRISPDGQRVAAASEEAESQIWLYDFARDALTRLTFEGANNVDPVWTPDGKRIAFKGSNRLFWQPADGSGAAEALTSSPLSPNDIPSSWSPDGQALVIVEQRGLQSLWILPLKDRKPQPFGHSTSGETSPRFSPDGHWIAYRSNESGRNEIYVRPYPGPGGKWQISTEGGTEPVWNPKGRELFYRNRDKMMVVEVTTQPAFSPGKPRLLFEGAYVPSPRSLPNYDVSQDGQRFLMLRTTEQAQAPTQINVVLNWFEELKRRVPSGGK